MRCPRQACEGAMHRFHPKHLVTAVHRADTGVLLEFSERQWRQVGLMCGRCGYMEFYAEEPAVALAEPAGFFSRTEPGSGP